MMWQILFHGLKIRSEGGIVKDEILEKWYTMPLKTKQEILDKFNVTTLQGVMENEKLREYVKENFLQKITVSQEAVDFIRKMADETDKKAINLIKSKLIRRES